MKCPACGVEILADALFCHHCGFKVLPENAKDKTDLSPGGVDADVSEPAEKFKKAAATKMDTVGGEETELWRGGFSPKAMIGNWIISGCVSVAILLLECFLLPWDWYFWVGAVGLAVAPWAYFAAELLYRRIGVSYVLTDQRFIHEKGILRRVTDRIEVIDMDDISFEQGILDRMMGVGTIRISSSDRSHPILVLRGIENVRDVSGLMDDNRRTQRRKRGLFVESI